MISRKAQLSLEYIGTFTIIMMALVIMGGVLFYFDLFNTERFSSQHCVFDANFYCHNFVINKQDNNYFNMTILLQNNMDDIIFIKQSKLLDKEGDEIVCDAMLIYCRYNESYFSYYAQPSNNKTLVNSNWFATIGNWTPTRLCRIEYYNCPKAVSINSKEEMNVELNFSGRNRGSTHLSYGVVYANVI